MKEFFTRDKANEGVKFPLYLPNGEKSDHWLLLLSIYSDKFRRVQAKGDRELSLFFSTIKDKPTDEQESLITEKFEEVKLKQLANLVADWSFEEELTEENAVKFLTNAPQVADAINKASAKTELFFGGNSIS